MMIVNIQKNMNRLPKILFALVVLSISLVSPAAPIRLDEQSDEKSAAIARIGIENFGKVNDHFYRGSLPKQSDYAALVALSVKTVISLRQRPDERVRQMAERAGMRYINLPMNVRGYPPEDLAPRFLDLVNNPENWPVYVYCHGGRHRTGVMTAIYRMAIEGWDVQRAYAEMRRYGFYKRWGHGPLKAYVLDYYCRLLEGASQSNYRRHCRFIRTGDNGRCSNVRTERRGNGAAPCWRWIGAMPDCVISRSFEGNSWPTARLFPYCSRQHLIKL